MTAISLLHGAGATGHDPVAHIANRIERARVRVKRERAAGQVLGRGESRYPVFDDGRFVGVVWAADVRPAFGPAAPTLLLRREN